MENLQRPGGELATRPIHFFWMVDCSGSMYGEKIGIVNNTIHLSFRSFIHKCVIFHMQL